MVFVRYFLKRFLGYFLVLSFFLALIFNLVEFFEKLIRVSNAQISTITYFITLNFLPSFSELMPLGGWLATILMLREFCQHQEWNTMLMLNISYNQVLKLFCLASVTITLFAFVIHEHVTVPLSSHATRFKLEKFKHKNTGKLISKSYLLPGNIFCHVGILDIKSALGNNIMLAYLSPTFAIEKIITSNKFSIDTEKQEIIMPNSTIFIPNNNMSEHSKKTRIKIPSFFINMRISSENPTLAKLTSTLIHSYELLSREISQDLLFQMRSMFYLQIFLYPILTFALFLFFEDRKRYVWLWLLLPYPVITAINLMTTIFFQYGINVYFVFIPYLLFGLFILLTLYRKNKPQLS